MEGEQGTSRWGRVLLMVVVVVTTVSPSLAQQGDSTPQRVGIPMMHGHAYDYDAFVERPLLTVIMIVKDEAGGIRETMESVRPFVDRYCILDTGSTDGTIDIIRETMAGVPGDVHQGPFVDFGTTRNEVIRLAGDVTTFALMLSGDEKLENGDVLRKYLQENELPHEDPKRGALLIRIKFGEDVFYDSPRVWRTGEGWHYVGVTHEYLTRDGVDAPDLRVEGVAITHSHQGQDKTASWRRDLHLLLQETQRNPKDCRSLFYLAQTYECLEQMEDAYAWYKKRVQCGGWHEEVYEAMYRLGRVAEALNMPWAEAQQHYLDAFQFAPERVEPLYAIQHHYFRREDHKLSMLFAKQAVSVPYPEEATLFVDHKVYNMKRHDDLAVSAYWTKETDLGIKHAKLALEMNPEDPRLIENLKWLELQMEEKARMVQAPSEPVAEPPSHEHHQGDEQTALGHKLLSEDDKATAESTDEQAREQQSLLSRPWSEVSFLHGRDGESVTHNKTSSDVWRVLEDPLVINWEDPRILYIGTEPIDGITKVPGWTPRDVDDWVKRPVYSIYNEGVYDQETSDVVDLYGIPDNYGDGLVAPHLLDRLPFFRAREAMRAWRRVLKPSGHLVVYCNDFGHVMKDQLRSFDQERWGVAINSLYGVTEWIMDDFPLESRRGEYKQLLHKDVFWYGKVKWLLEDTGFYDIQLKNGFQHAWTFDLPFPPRNRQQRVPKLVMTAKNGKRVHHRDTSHVPNIVHFIYGLSPDFGGRPFDIIQYLAVKSAYDVWKPRTIYFYHVYEPSGFWWEKARPYLTLEKVEDVTEIYGNPVTHFAHKADVIRLRVLKERGGIYMDMDAIALNPMPELFDFEFVMGEEGVEGEYGMCNAIMMGKPNATFVNRWLEEYKTFDSSSWGGHSIELPKRLAKEMPDALHILNYRRWFWPLWGEADLEYMFEGTGYDWSFNYAVHLWESKAYQYIEKLSVEYIRSVDTNFNVAVRRFLDDI